MSLHPIAEAAEQFLADEDRRAKRGQRQRMSEADRGIATSAAVVLREYPHGPGTDTPTRSAQRGLLAVDLFGYDDDFDDKAATVITDILHACAARGGFPQSVLNQVALYYAEEVPPQ